MSCALPPFQVIYQTAEDGLGDTVKPRLIEAEADLDRVLVIDEAKRELTLSDELLSGAGGNTATKTKQAEKLILDLLADGKELASEEIVKAAAKAGISERTVQNAKRNMSDILGARRVGGQWYNTAI